MSQPLEALALVLTFDDAGAAGLGCRHRRITEIDGALHFDVLVRPITHLLHLEPS